MSELQRNQLPELVLLGFIYFETDFYYVALPGTLRTGIKGCAITLSCYFPLFSVLKKLNHYKNIWGKSVLTSTPEITPNAKLGAMEYGYWNTKVCLSAWHVRSSSKRLLCCEPQEVIRTLSKWIFSFDSPHLQTFVLEVVTSKTFFWLFILFFYI